MGQNQASLKVAHELPIADDAVFVVPSELLHTATSGTAMPLYTARRSDSTETAVDLNGNRSMLKSFTPPDEVKFLTIPGEGNMKYIIALPKDYVMFTARDGTCIPMPCATNNNTASFLTTAKETPEPDLITAHSLKERLTTAHSSEVLGVGKPRRLSEKLLITDNTGTFLGFYTPLEAYQEGYIDQVTYGKYSGGLPCCTAHSGSQLNTAHSGTFASNLSTASSAGEPMTTARRRSSIDLFTACPVEQPGTIINDQEEPSPVVKLRTARSRTRPIQLRTAHSKSPLQVLNTRRTGNLQVRTAGSKSHISVTTARSLEADPSIQELIYYHGTLKGGQVINLLRYKGDFLLYQDSLGHLVLSARRGDGGGVWNQLLLPDVDGLYHLPREPHAKTVVEFINYYVKSGQPIVDDVVLINAVPKDSLDTASITEVGNEVPLSYYYDSIKLPEMKNLLKREGDFILRHDRQTGRYMVSVRTTGDCIRHIRLPEANDAGQYPFVDGKGSSPNVYTWIEHHIKNEMPIKSNCLLRRAITHKQSQ